MGKPTKDEATIERVASQSPDLRQELLAGLRVLAPEAFAEGIYDGVPFDSETIEKPFIEALEKCKDVKLYIKLPSWFRVAMPVGDYNPDWAIVMENPDGGDDLLYLVRETKGSLDPDNLRPDERRKIACGRRHFADALDVNYRVVTNASQLPSGGV